MSPAMSTDDNHHPSKLEGEEDLHPSKRLKSATPTTGSSSLFSSLSSFTRAFVGGSKGNEAAAAGDRDRYVVPAEEVLRLTFVTNPKDVLKPKESFEWFSPEFTHQVFGQDEVVRGYETARVFVFIHATTFHALVTVKTTGKAPEGELKADDVRFALTETLGLQYTEDFDDFVKRVSESDPAVERCLSSGAASSCTDFQVSSTSERVEIVRFNPADSDAKALQGVHDRLQAMPLLYIDGANYIDNTDPKWEVYLAFVHSGTAAAEKHLAGFCTVYSFYAYPARRRLRLSQILVFPPFQRRGIASKILEQVYARARECGALDLTVEDPSEAFQLLRESVDVKRIVGSSSFYVDAVEDLLSKSKLMLSNGIRADTLLLPTRAVYERAERELKIHKAQLRKVWEVLLLMRLKSSNWEDDGLVQRVVEQIVRARLSSQESEKRLRDAARNKLVVDFKDDNFMMTKFVYLAPSQQVKYEERSEEDKAKSVAYDKDVIQTRMECLEKINQSLIEV